MPHPASPPPTPLLQVALETENHVAGDGWDQAPRLFALVPTRAVLGTDEPDPAELSAVEQEWSPEGDLESALARLAWPEAVVGVALVLERLVVPPAAEHDLPSNPDDALAALAAHPDRQDIRLVAAVTREGERTCLLRQRAYDRADMIASGPDIAEGLVTALAATLVD